jgi:type I restriction enzyme S subunit
MIADLKPYAKYKESGLPWLGKVPVHWDKRRMKFLFKERVQKGFPDEPLLAATQSKGVVRKADYGTRTVTASKDFHLLKLVEKDDFVISLRSFEGGIEVSHCRGIISPAYTVLSPRPEASQGYYARFFKSADFISSLTLFVTGIREGQNIDYERLSRAYMPLPPIDEQAAIGRFLDWANGRLERAIRAKRKVIALLNEQKQAIIHRAVTRGLDPSVPLKPSGIPWLGDIPRHWQTRKIKFLVSTVGGMTPNKGQARFWGGQVPWVSPKDMKRREISDSQDHITEVALRETNISLIQPPAVLIVVRGMILARTFPTALTTVPVTVNQDMKALIPKPELNADFFVSLLTGIKGEVLNLIGESGHGTKCLRTDSWENLFIPLPPVAEQIKINGQLDTELSEVNTTILYHEREIDLLREYRTRLVADVVTGKLDVREAAARLPDAAESEIPEIDEAEPDSEEADEEVLA